MEMDPGFSSSPSILAFYWAAWYTMAGAVTYGGWPTTLRTCPGEVVLMGDERWARALRAAFWFIIALALMVATAQKAC